MGRGQVEQESRRPRGAFALKAIVHIGTEKTGTTSIQKYLHENRKKLRSAGLHFLHSAGETNNRALPAYCMSDSRVDEFYREMGIFTPQEREAFRAGFIRDFDKELRTLPASIHTVVISSEHFHSRIRLEEELDNVHSLLSRYFDEIRIICYLREQAATCISYYSTHLKAGGLQSFSHFLKRCTPDDYYYNYHAMLLNWERRFGRAALEVALFSPDHFLNGDLLDDFTARLDRRLVGRLKRKIRIENESLSPGGQVLALALNRAVPVREASREVVALHNQCKMLIYERLRGRGQQPDAAVCATIFEAFRESNEALRQKFLPQSASLFAPMQGQAALGFDLDEDVIEVLSAVLRTLGRSSHDVLARRDCMQACSQILLSVVQSMNEQLADGGARRILSLDEEDARLLRHSAMLLHKRQLAYALRLLTLSAEIDPDRPGVTARIKEYRAQLDNQEQRDAFIVSFFADNLQLSQIDADAVASLGQWLRDQDYAYLIPTMALADTVAVAHSAAPLPAVTRSPSFYLVVQAGSQEEVLAEVRKLPVLDCGLVVEVAKLVPFMQ